MPRIGVALSPERKYIGPMNNRELVNRLLVERQSLLSAAEAIATVIARLEPGKSKPGVSEAKPRASTPKKPAKAKAKRAPRAASASTEENITSVSELLASAAEPMKAEDLRSESKLDKKAFSRAMALAVSRGLVTKSGQKRSTCYAAAPQNGASAEA